MTQPSPSAVTEDVDAAASSDKDGPTGKTRPSSFGRRSIRRLAALTRRPTSSDDDKQHKSSGPSEDLVDNDVDAAHQDTNPDVAPAASRRRTAFLRVLTFVVLPFTALLLTLAAGYLKYEDSTARLADRARSESVQAAKDSTIAMLSYTPETADAQLTAAGDRLTGTFRDSYASLIKNVVIPGTKQKRVSATAVVPAAASVSASENHAVVLLFVDQTITIGNDPPTNTASVVQVTLDKLANRWLIAGFDPK